ncbi:MAG: hypothetical protein ACUVWR_05800 [Anaerolineae bacterium]
MSSSATWNGTSVLSRTNLRRGPRFRGFGHAGANAGLVYLIAGFLVGLVVGLPILGWWVWPVQVSNATPSDLAPAYQQAYIAMAADSYALNGDLPLAKARLGTWEQGDIATIVSSLEATAVNAGSQVQAKRLQQLRQDLNLGSVRPSAAVEEATAGMSHQQAPARAAQRSNIILPALLALVLLIGFGLLVGGFVLYRRSSLPELTGVLSRLRALKLLQLRASSPRRAGASAVRTPTEGADTVSVSGVQSSSEAAEEEISLDQAFNLLAEELDSEEGKAQPALATAPSRTTTSAAIVPGQVVGNFLATYRHGAAESFDTSYSIETDDGEFLGECGVGVAETVGESSPERACAMEIWLFDKSDIRTATKLIVSDYAMQDNEIREAIAGRGEVTRAQSGQTIKLDTAGLTLTVQVLDLKYAESPDAPPKSYFQELSIELTAVQK